MNNNHVSPYNEFMKKNISEYTKQHPTLDYKTVFVAVCGMWRTAAENPNKISNRNNADNKTSVNKK